MGNRESILEDIRIYKPPIEDLIFKDPGIQFKIYQHRYSNYEVMAHKITLNEEWQLPILIEHFKARYQHHYLVSTLFIDCEDYSTCGGYFQSVIFYQRIFTNLSKIKDIPFPDVLHFYAVALKGFQILFQRFGYFQVYEDMFHLGQDSKLKVWCNRDISKNEPESYLIDRTGTQQDMVRKIIFIIDQNTDHLTDKVKIKDKLLAYGVRNFQMSHISLRQVCRQYNFSVPQRVQCMTSLTSNQVQSMLDLYSSGNKINQASLLPKIVQNLNTPYPVRSNVETINTKNTPYFNPRQISHTPITQQFIIPSNLHPSNLHPSNLHPSNLHPSNLHPSNLHPSNMHPLSFYPSNLHASNIPELNLSKIQNRNNEQSMTHTFNERPQIPNIQNRHGINLTLVNGKHRKASDRQNLMHPQMRDRSLPSPRKHQIIQSNDVRYKSLERKPQIKINFVNQNKLTTPVLTNYQTLQQRFSKPQAIYHQNQHINGGFPAQIKREYQKQPHQFTNIPESLSRINISPINQQRYYSHDQVNRNVQSKLTYNPAPNILSRPTQILKKSGHLVNISNLPNSRNIAANNVIQSNFNKRIQNYNQHAQNHEGQPSIKMQQQQAPQRSKQYDSSNYQTRERRNLSKHTNKYQYQQSKHTNQYQKSKQQFSKTTKQLHYPSNIEQQALKKNVSTPVLNNGQNYLFQKTRQSPFRIIEQKNNIKIAELPNAYENLNLQVPIERNSGSQFNNVHSASSRYLYSNRQLNDNIPDLKYKKSSPKKNIGQLFDTKIQELQSFNESKFGTQNSLKDFQNRNSQVLEIIGRSKKDSVTSAFDNQQLTRRPDQIKQFNVSQNSYNYLKQESAHHNKDKNKDSFTDPKILQILRKPSSKALQYQINNLKKISKSTKSYEFSNELSAKRPTVKKQIKEDFMKLDRNWETQKPYNFEQKNGKQNFTQFQGFPSLSNLSEINNAEQLSFNEDKVNTTLNNAKATIKKSRFSEQKIVIKKQQNAVSEFYQYDYQSPKYEYSFAGKRQVPMQDNEWKAKYGTTFNSGKDEPTSTLQKTNDFKASPLKPFNFLANFNSNESLASLQFEMSKRHTNMLKNTKDQVIQSFAEYSQQLKSTNQQHQINPVSNTRKYNPKLDPQISKDLERFRKQKFEFSKK